MRRPFLPAAALLLASTAMWMLGVLAVSAQTDGGGQAAEGAAGVGTVGQAEAEPGVAVDESPASSAAGAPNGVPAGVGSTGERSSPAKAAASSPPPVEMPSSVAASSLPAASSQPASPSGSPGGSQNPRSSAAVSSKHAASSSVKPAATVSSTGSPARSSARSSTRSSRAASSIHSSRAASSAAQASRATSSVRSARASSSQRSQSRVSSIASAVESSASSSLHIVTPSDTHHWQRENLGYSVPVIDPNIIVRPSQFALTPGALSGNLLLALLFTLVMGFSGEVLRRLAARDGEHLRRQLGRLPFQAFLTLILVWLIRLFIPSAAAQGLTGNASTSLLGIPFFAVLFFVVVGASNSLFNSMVLTEGNTLARLPGIKQAWTVLQRKGVSRALWFVLTLILLYGIVGAHINPQFNLFPSQQTGIILVAIITIIAAAYAVDAARWVIARRWKCPAWFEANIPGLLVALLCVYVSREFQLNPGFIYGLPVGLFLALRTEKHEGVLESFSLTWMLALAFVFWLIIPSLDAYQIPLDVGNLLFVILIEGVFFELLPFPSLAGGIIFRWRKAIWALLFFLTIFFLFHTLFNPQGTIATINQSPPTLFALMCLGCYAVGVFVLWGYVMWRRSSNPR